MENNFVSTEKKKGQREDLFIGAPNEFRWLMFLRGPENVVVD